MRVGREERWVMERENEGGKGKEREGDMGMGEEGGRGEGGKDRSEQGEERVQRKGEYGEEEEGGRGEGGEGGIRRSGREASGSEGKDVCRVRDAVQEMETVRGVKGREEIRA